MEDVLSHLRSSGLCYVDEGQRFGSGRPFLFYVVRLHGSPNFERGYIRCVRRILREAAVPLLLVEGAAANNQLNPDLMRFFPEKEKNMQLVALMLLNGEATGTEYILMADPPGVEAWGIETIELYRKQYDAIKVILASAKMWQRTVDHLLALTAVNCAEATIAPLERKLELLRMLLGGELTSADSATIAGMDFEHESLLAELSRVIPNPETYREFACQGNEYGSALTNAMLFYDLLTARTNAMVYNGLARMRELGRDVAILSGGGAHQHGIEGALTAAEVSYAVITPRFVPMSSDRDRYGDTMLERRKSNITVVVEGEDPAARAEPEEAVAPRATREDAIQFVVEMGDSEYEAQ